MRTRILGPSLVLLLLLLAVGAARAGDAPPAPDFDRVDHAKPERYLDLPATIGRAARIREIAAGLAGATPRERLREIGRWIDANLRCFPDAADGWRDFAGSSKTATTAAARTTPWCSARSRGRRGSRRSG